MEQIGYFKNKTEALGWLQDMGFKVGKSKFYEDGKQKGRRKPLYKMEADGSITKRSIELYAKTLDRTGGPQHGVDAAVEKKVRAELDKVQKQAALLDFELSIKQGKMMPRADCMTEKAENAGAIFAGISNHILQDAGELLQACGGNPARMGDFVRAITQTLELAADNLASLDQFEFIKQ